MKENKRIILYALIVSILTIIISPILHFGISSDVAIYISNILLNIFAGTVVLIGTSLMYYFVERRRILTKIMDECLFLIEKFSNLNYLEDYEFCSYEEWFEYYNKNSKFKKNEIKDMYEKAKERYQENQIIKMEDEMKKYISISDIKLTKFWHLYEGLDFLWCNKNKFYIYDLLFDYTRKVYNMIWDRSVDFKIYFESNNGNKKANYNFVRELQTNIFYYEVHPLKKAIKWKKDLTNLSFNYHEDILKKTASITTNKVVEQYYDIIDRIGKIAYFDKKYQYKNEEE